jgi:DNA-binding HxlR family transcriptional regulator
MSDFESNFGSCPMYYTVSVMAGKWKWVILWRIYRAGVIRYNTLRGQLHPIAHKTLSAQLKELETDELIHREQYNEVPPRVEYSLTEEGRTLIPILDLMYQWGKEHMK